MASYIYWKKEGICTSIVKMIMLENFLHNRNQVLLKYFIKIKKNEIKATGRGNLTHCFLSKSIHFCNTEQHLKNSIAQLKNIFFLYGHSTRTEHSNICAA